MKIRNVIASPFVVLAAFSLYIGFLISGEDVEFRFENDKSLRGRFGHRWIP